MVETMLKVYECLKSCESFIEGFTYRGECRIMDLFGALKISIIEVYPYNGDKLVVMPTSYFKEDKGDVIL